VVKVLKNRDVLPDPQLLGDELRLLIVFNWFSITWSRSGVQRHRRRLRDLGAMDRRRGRATLGGWLCDRMCRTVGLRWGCRWPIILGMGVSVLLLLVGAFHPSAWIAVTAMVLLFFFNQINEGPYWAASMAVGGRHAGAAGGVMNTGANAMGIVNSLLVPWLAFGFGWTVAIASAAVFGLVGIILMLLVRADRPVEPGPVSV
jgi:MFS family permease